MAKIHRGGRSLKRQARQYLLLSAVCIGLIAAYGFLLARGGAAAVPPIFHALPVVWLVGAVYYHRKYGDFRAGAAGEAELLRALKRLPASYHVFTNFVVVERGVRDEADFVVVGETGVFVVEAKNYCGRIAGGAADDEWEQRRLVKGGREATRRIPNPLRQARWHAVNVERLLRGRGFAVGARPLLVFTSRYVRVTAGPDCGLPLLCGGEAAVAAILARPEKKLGRKAVGAIAAFLAERL